MSQTLGCHALDRDESAQAAEGQREKKRKLAHVHVGDRNFTGEYSARRRVSGLRPPRAIQGGRYYLPSIDGGHLLP